MKSAFTFIELIFSIVIVAIMSLVGMDVIANISNEYARGLEIHRMESKLDNAITVLSRNMGYRVRESVIARVDGAIAFVSIDNKTANENVVEWIGYDYDGLVGEGDSTHINMPGWSGFVDIDANETNATHLKSPGSFFSVENDLVYYNSHERYDLNTTFDVAVVFKTHEPDVKNGYGWGNDNNHTRLFPVKRYSETVLEYEPSSAPSRVYEHYVLVWSAYGLSMVGRDLILYQNYRPWFGERYDSSSSTKTLLLDDVIRFEVNGKGDVLRLKICIDNNQTKDNFVLCKDKVIL